MKKPVSNKLKGHSTNIKHPSAEDGAAGPGWYLAAILSSLNVYFLDNLRQLSSGMSTAT